MKGRLFLKNLIYKEFALSTPPLTFIFLAFTLMTFIPGYPILCGAFFVCFGIFQGYQFCRENNDILFSVLLPVRKKDIVAAKFISAVIIQMAAFLLFSVFTLFRMIFLPDAGVYIENPMMNANLVFLAYVLIVFSAFNIIFLCGFFRTAYGIGKPFVLFIGAGFSIIGIAEVLHHIPGLGWLNTSDFTLFERQIIILAAAVILYFAATYLSCRTSRKKFEKIDL